MTNYGVPHHVTQRGNRGERIFFGDDDYALYRDSLAESCRKFGVEVWAYCQTPNHAHLILTPSDASGLGLAFPAPTASMPASSTPGSPDRPSVSRALRLGSDGRGPPDRRRALRRARSSSRASSHGPKTGPIPASARMRRARTTPWSKCARSSTASRFADLMETDADDPAFIALRRSELIGRPLGSKTFIRGAEAHLGRTLAPARRGPKPKTTSAAPQEGI